MNEGMKEGLLQPELKLVNEATLPLTTTGWQHTQLCS